MKLSQRILLTVLSGGIATFAFPPFACWPLAFLAWPLLFLAVRGSGFRVGTRLGVLHGLVLYGLTLSWFWNIFQTMAIALWTLLALFTGLAAGLAGWTSQRWPAAKWLPIFAAVSWSCVEYYRCEWFWLRFPWITPGIALGPTWLSPIIGAYGAGFFVILAAAYLAGNTKRQRLVGAVLALALATFGTFRPSPVKEVGSGIPVLAVQSENLDLTTYRERTEESGFRSGIALWPEYAAPFFIREGPDDLGKLRTLAKSQDLTIVFGTQQRATGGKHFNEALTLDGDGILGSHFKNRPVPFMDDGQPGTSAIPVVTRYGTLGTPICFDCDYAEVIRRMTTGGVEVFTVPSLDATRWSRRQHLQHSEFFRHRALENGRWFAVCAASGMTQIIDPHGNRIATIPLLEDGILRGTVYPRRELTFYTRFGWLMPWILTVMAVSWTAWLIAIRRREITRA